MYNKVQLGNIEALVKLPDNYLDTMKYPVFIGLSGGEQTIETVTFSANTYFSSELFKDYIHIVPINTNQKNFKDYSAEEIFALIDTIKHLFSTTDTNWTVSGISNGGKATFLFVAANPKLFETVFTFPGGLFDVVPTNEWGHLKIVLANGKKDGYGWLQESKKSFEILLPIAKKVELMVISGQKHIISEDYDINQIYNVIL